MQYIRDKGDKKQQSDICHFIYGGEGSPTETKDQEEMRKSAKQIYDRSGIAKRWRNSNYSINGAGRIDYPFGEK